MFGLGLVLGLGFGLGFRRRPVAAMVICEYLVAQP